MNTSFLINAPKLALRHRLFVHKSASTQLRGNVCLLVSHVYNVLFQAEKIASRMIYEDRMRGSIDQVRMDLRVV